MKHGSLFSGIGGIDLGFEMAGIKTVWNCEIDEWCRDLLKKRFPDAKQYQDVKEIGKHNLESVDIISGGFPCQDISVAGKGEGLDGKRSGLWFEMWRIISELRPSFALIENVQLLTKRGGTRVLSDLAEIGYDAEWQIISAAGVGARHLRKRLWIIAYPTKNSNTGSNGRKLRVKCEEKSDGGLNGKRELEGRKASELCWDVSWKSEEEVSDTSVQGLERHRGDSKLQVRNTSEESIQREPRTAYEVPHSSSIEHTVGSTEEGGEEQVGGVYFEKEEQTQHDLWSETPGCGELPGTFKVPKFQILEDEPDVGRVANGDSLVLDRYKDRIKGLGNGVLPQIPYIIGKRIKEIYDEQS